MPILRAFLQILQASRVWSFSHIKGTTSEPRTPRIHRSHCFLNPFGPWRNWCVKTVADVSRIPGKCFCFSYQKKMEGVGKVTEDSVTNVQWLQVRKLFAEEVCPQLVPGVVDEKFKSFWSAMTREDLEYVEGILILPFIISQFRGTWTKPSLS